MRPLQAPGGTAGRISSSCPRTSSPCQLTTARLTVLSWSSCLLPRPPSHSGSRWTWLTVVPPQKSGTTSCHLHHRLGTRAKNQPVSGGQTDPGGGAYLQLLSGRTRLPSASAADCCSPERQDISSEDGKSPSRTAGTAADLVGVDGHRDDGGRVQDAPPFGRRLPGAGLSRLRGGGVPGYSGLLQMVQSPTGFCCLWDFCFSSSTKFSI